MALVATLFLNALANFVLGLLLARFLGPAPYGSFAIAAAGAGAVVFPAIDWLRHAAIRYYSARSRQAEPQVRASLDAVAAGGAGLLVLATTAALALGAPTPVTLTCIAGIYVGLGAVFDYQSALARSLARNGLYAGLTVLRHATTLSLMPLTALATADPGMTMLAGCAGLAASIAAGRLALRDPEAGPKAATLAEVRRLAAFGIPIVAAGSVTLLQSFYNRAHVGAAMGLDAAGQFALAYDMGIRVIALVGTAAEVLLLPLAVRAAREDAQAGRAQLARNMAGSLALLCACAAGYALLVHPFAAVVVPEAFRATFPVVTLWLLPGLVFWALGMFVVGPVFHVAGRTIPIAVPSLVALAANILIDRLPGHVSDPVGQAQSFSLACAVGFAVLAAVAVSRRAPLPRWRDVAGVLAATAAMAAVVAPLTGSMGPAAALAVLAPAGGLAFAAVCVIADVGGVQALLRSLRA